MRVLHLIHSFPPYSFGGTERYVGMIAQSLASHGIESSVLTPVPLDPREPADASPMSDSVPVIRVPQEAGSHATPVGHNDYVQRFLEETLASRGIDLLHVHHWHGLTADAVWVAHVAGVPSVVTLHDYFTTCVRFHRVREQSERCEATVSREACARCVRPMLEAPIDYLVARLGEREGTYRRELQSARAVLTLSQWQADYLARVPALREIPLRVLPLPAPLPVGAAATVAAELTTMPTSADEDRVRLVNWGGLDPGKGLDDLIDACEQSAAATRFEVHHHGRILDEAFANRLRSRVVRTRLVLHGPFEERALLDHFAGYDAAVFPSRYMETHGFVVDEALAIGLPVIVPDVGAPQERIGRRGSVYRAGDVADLRRCLERLLDRDVRDALRQAPAPRLVTSDAHCAELAAIYRASVGDVRATPSA